MRVSAASGGSGGNGKNPFSTVEAAVKFLAELLSAGDMFGTVGTKKGTPYAARSSAGDDGGDAKVELRGWKWIKIRGKASSTLRVPTSEDTPLDAYLQLPPEKYALLDPKFVTRESPTTFRFTVPLREVMSSGGAYGGSGEAKSYSPSALLRELTPTIVFETEVDTARQLVSLSGAGAELGNDELDKRFDLGIDTTLSWEAVFDPVTTVGASESCEGEERAQRRRDVRQGVVMIDDGEDGCEVLSGDVNRMKGSDGNVMEAEFIDTADNSSCDDTEGGWRWRGKRGAKDGTGDLDVRAACPPHWELGVTTKLSMRVQVPRPLSLAPSFLLGGAFSVIAGAVMQAIVPRFAEFLAADYKRWVKGEDREVPVGSFVDDEVDESRDGEEMRQRNGGPTNSAEEEANIVS